jgi:PEP-CTERM motif
LQKPFYLYPEFKMKKSMMTIALSLPLLASASNLVANGSFEVGTVGDPGSSWLMTEGVHLWSPAQIQYLPHPGAAFGEDVPADNAISLSPDEVGEHGIYFVDDSATQTLTSASFTAPATGFYNFGFSAYAPGNGYGNPGDSSFSLVLGGVTLANTVSSLGMQTWSAQTGMAELTGGQTYQLLFTFTGGGQMDANDIVVDRFYVGAVPEPGTYALMLAGLMATVGLARRRLSV